ncbi:nucleotidyltransferase domain-containing protein [Candidatus Woesearchaeota archaeon]|nr:nucleotidyltransferase domain-containing protein [Candidatus Woesearchaeota archaeon]
MSLSDLAAKLNISKTTANHAVAKLKGEGFLEVKEFGRAWGITCRKGHAYHYSKKIAYNLLLVYASSIVEEVKRAVQNPLSIALFGSYRKGDDNEHSDIDIAVEVLGSKELEIIELGTFPLFGYRKNVKLNLHVFSRKKVDSNLFANIANGIVLDGFLEAKP